MKPLTVLDTLVVGWLKMGVYFLFFILVGSISAQELLDKELKKQVSLQEQFFAAMFDKADSLVTINKIKEAQQVFDKAYTMLEIAPHNSKTLHYTRLVEEFYSEILIDYDRAFEIIDFLDQKCLQHKDDKGRVLLANRAADLHKRKLEYILSLKSYNKGLELAEKNSYNTIMWDLLINRGVLFSTMGDNELAAKDYKKALNYIEEGDPRNIKGHTYLNISSIFSEEEPDSIIYYSKLVLEGHKGKPLDLITSLAYNNIADIYCLKKQPQKAKDIILNTIGLNNEFNKNSFDHTLHPAMMHTLGIAEYELGNYGFSLKYLKKSVQGYQKLGYVTEWLDTQEDLSKTYEALGNLSESLRIHKEIKAAEISQFRIRMAKEIAREESKRMLIAQEDEICGLEEKNDSIEEEMYVTQWLIYVLGFVLLVAIGILLYRGYHSRIRYYQANEQLVLTKLTSLRISMNPHFLFNTFSTLQNFILKKDNTNANEYMTELSGLIRNVLNTSDSVYIDFITELQILKSYVNLQQGRFRGEFDATFVVDPVLKQSNPQMPSMIIQPIIENAILHGFSHLEKKGILHISLVAKGAIIQCVVKDNGIGRAASEAIKKTTRKNMNLSIATKNTSERLAILNKASKEPLDITIHDLVDAEGDALGTEVVITLPMIKNEQFHS